VATASDQFIRETLATLATLVLVAGGLALLVRLLARSRPGLSIGYPVGVALVTRIAAAGLLSLTPIASTLRGGDELGFLAQAQEIAQAPLGSAPWGEALVGKLHVFVFAVQRFALDSPDLALRSTQAGIAVAGLALLSAAVYELAGARAATLAIWLLALEPTGVFFSTLLHKEANMLLASGLVALGGAIVWRRGEPRALAPMVLGCLIAVATRPYAGWFLIAATAATVLHAGLRPQQRGSVRSLGLIAVVVLFAAVAAPTVLKASTDQSLQQNVQSAQEANSTDSSNLKLERVDFSSREAIVFNLPRRIRDVLIRPYPWQLEDVSQEFGLVGTTVAYVVIALLLWTALENRGRLMERAAPLWYLAFFLLIAYSLSTGNAGTGFRYRTHLLTIAICILVVLRVGREAAPAREPISGTRPPLPGREPATTSA
jgi:hypothetical protein